MVSSPRTPKHSPESRTTQRSGVLSKGFLTKKISGLIDPSIVPGKVGTLDSSSPTSHSADYVYRDNTLIKNSPTALGQTTKHTSLATLPLLSARQTSSLKESSASKPSQSPPTTTGLPIQAEGHPMDLTLNTGFWCEIGLGLAAMAIFIGLYIFLITGICYNLIKLIWWIEAFSGIGAVTGAFVAVYVCFERSMAPRKGFTGCMFLSSIVIVAAFNLIGAYLATGCICKCDGYTLKDGGPDLVILLLELLGASCLLAVVLVGSITRSAT